MSDPVTRFSLPHLDLIIIRTPSAIKQAELSQDLERVQHAHPTHGTLPFPFNLYFPKTRFLSTSHGYFLPMVPQTSPTYSPCLAFLNAKLNHHPTDMSNYVTHAADLLDQSFHDDVLLSKALADALFAHFDGPVPQDIIQHAQKQLSSPLSILNPFNAGAQHHLDKVYQYVQNALTDLNLIQDLPPRIATDVAQTILAPAQVAPTLLRAIYKNPDQTVERTFAELTLTRRVIRVAKRPGTLQGLLKTPLNPQKSIVLLDIASAATETQQYEWVFSAGTDRRCTAERALVSFCDQLRTELLDRRAQRLQHSAE